MTYVLYNCCQEPSVGSMYIDINTLTDSGLMNFCGKMAASGMMIASSTAIAKVTPKART